MSYENQVDLESDVAQSGEPVTPFGMLVDGLNSVGSVLILMVMLLMCTDVLARNLFNSPIHGVAELVAISIVTIVFLQLASTLRHGRMSRADIFIDEYAARRPRNGNALLAVFNAAGAAMCTVVIWATLPVFQRAWEDNEYIGVEGVFTAPTWPVRLIVIIGTSAAAIQYVLLIVKHLKLTLEPHRAEEKVKEKLA